MRVWYLRYLCISALLLVAASAWGESTERLFGIVPQYSPQQSAQQWQPLIDHIKDATGISVRFATASRVSAFEQRVMAGQYDFAYLDPLMYLEAQRRAGYRALARDDAVSHGILVVRRDGPRSLAELAGKAIAFPAPVAVGGTILVRRDLRLGGIFHDLAYLGTHESVYRAVSAGQYAAGGGTLNTFAQSAPALRQELRVLHRTAPFVSHIVAVHPRVPAAEVGRVRRVLLTLHAQERTQGLLKPMGFRRLIPVRANDLAGLKDIDYPHTVRRATFHVIPRLSEADTRTYMLPLTVYVRQKLELELTLKTYANMGAFVQAIASENGPALINANPTQALDLMRRGYEVLAQQLPHDLEQGMQAVLLVRHDAPYRTLADLRGKRIAFGGGPNAFFASIVPRVMLKRAGLHGQYRDASAAATGPVAQVLQQLDAGEVDAIAIATPALQNKRLRERYVDGRMRVLAASDRLPGLPWLVSPAVDSDTRDALRYLLVNFGTDAPGHAELAATGTERLTAADNATYAPVAQYLKELAEP